MLGLKRSRNAPVLSSNCSFLTLYTEFANTTLHALKPNQFVLKAIIDFLIPPNVLNKHSFYILRWLLGLRINTEVFKKG